MKAVESETAFHASQLLGPWGGLLGLVYALGCASGWRFHHSTVHKLLNSQIQEMKDEHRRDRDDCKADIAALKHEAASLREELIMGWRRQAMQVSQSAEQLTGRVEGGRITPIDEL